MQIDNPMTVLTPAQVEQVSGGDKFGYYLGFGAALGVPGGAGITFAHTWGKAVSDFEDWVNGA